jgi:hypothetical protein
MAHERHHGGNAMTRKAKGPAFHCPCGQVFYGSSAAKHTKTCALYRKSREASWEAKANEYAERRAAMLADLRAELGLDGVTAPDLPTVEEYTAVLRAVVAFAGRPPEDPVMARDVPHLMDELSAALARMRAVTEFDPTATGSEPW